MKVEAARSSSISSSETWAALRLSRTAHCRARWRRVCVSRSGSSTAARACGGGGGGTAASPASASASASAGDGGGVCVCCARCDSDRVVEELRSSAEACLMRNMPPLRGVAARSSDACLTLDSEPPTCDCSKDRSDDSSLGESTELEFALLRAACCSRVGAGLLGEPSGT